MITTQMVAVAVVAAAKLTGLRPDQAFGEGPEARRTRIVAAAGLRARLGLDPKSLARVFQLGSAQCLTPSMLDRSAIGSEALLVVSEALREAGIGPKGRTVSQPAAPEAAGTPARDKPARAHVASVPPPAPAERPAPYRPPERQPVQQPAERKPAREPLRLVPTDRTDEVPTLERPPIAPRRTRAPRQRGRPAVERLKPVSARVLKYARRFPHTHWTIDEVAELFDVCPDDLAEKLAATPEAEAA